MNNVSLSINLKITDDKIKCKIEIINNEIIKRYYRTIKNTKTINNLKIRKKINMEVRKWLEQNMYCLQ